MNRPCVIRELRVAENTILAHKLASPHLACVTGHTAKLSVRANNGEARVRGAFCGSYLGRLFYFTCISWEF